MAKEGYEIFGNFLSYESSCRLSEKFGQKGKFATFSTLKVWKNGKTFKTIYVHDSLRGGNEVFSEEIEREKIPQDAFKKEFYSTI